MVRYVPPDDAEIHSFQRLCERCKVRPGCAIVVYSKGPPTLSKRNARQSEELDQLAFFGMLHKVIARSRSQNRVATCRQSKKGWDVSQIKRAALPGTDVEVLEKG